MFEGLVEAGGISFLMVFVEGLLSFFSPCILPLLPVYISYLAGNTGEMDPQGQLIYKKGPVLLHTVFFILGISCAFFLLSASLTALGNFLMDSKLLFSRLGGMIIMGLGLCQLGIFQLPFLQRSHQLTLDLAGDKISPWLAALLGFTFSFAWTPCVGPALSSVLIMASGAKTAWLGNLLVLVYTLGFVLPFLALGLWTTQALRFFKNQQKFLKYTVKVGGLLLVFMGWMTLTGWTNRFSGYLTSYQNPPGQVQVEETPSASAGEGRAETLKAFDFTLTDQYGQTHSLSDYKGQVVFLNFWTSWCQPCQREMPYIEALYQEYHLNKDEVVFLGVANPSSDAYPGNADKSKEEISEFLADQAYTYPVVFDETGKVFAEYSIGAYPTTFMIDPQGNIYGYLSATLTKEQMIRIIQQTQAGSKASK